MKQTCMDFFEFDRFCLLELKNSEFKVYTALMLHRNMETSEAFPSQRLLAEESKLCLRTVNTAIKGLFEKGFILISKRKRKLGHNNIYELLKFPTFTKKKEEEVPEEPTPTPNDPFDDLESIQDDIYKDTYDKEKENKDNCYKLIRSKTCLELTEWQTYIIKKHMDDQRFVLRACTIYKRKKGRSFAFFLELYITILSEQNMLSKQFLIDTNKEIYMNLANF